MLKVIVVFVFFLLSFPAFAAEVVFEGHPTKKIEVSEQTAGTYEITKSQASEYKVVIERDGDKYYWRTRNNLQLIPMQSGVYITFLAINGSGYVRILNNTMMEMYKMLPEEEKQKSYLYMEHLIHQLGSITYYGR